MILEIEDFNGNTIGAILLNENGLDGDIDIHKVCGDLSIADIDLDDIFNTNESKVRIQLEVEKWVL